MFRVTSPGDFSKTRKFLTKITRGDIYASLRRYGQEGADALSASTPVDSTVTSRSWEYRIIRDRRRIGIEWYNTHIVDGAPIAILLQYGHGTGTGGYVQGRDYINPALRPIFDRIADDVWKKVRAA